MTQFGNRDIPIIPARAAVPQRPPIDDIGRIVGDVLRSTTGMVQAQTQDIQRQMQLESVAAQLKAMPHEVEMAQTRMEQEQLRTEALKLRFATIEGQEKLEQLRQAETSDILGMMQGMPGEKRAAFLKQMPVYDPEVRGALQVNLAETLSLEMETRLQQLVQEDIASGEQDRPRHPTNYIEQLFDEFSVDALDPEVRARLEQRVLSMAHSHYNRVLAARAQQEQVEAQTNAQELLSIQTSGIARSLLSASSDAQLSEAVGPILETISNASKILGQPPAVVRRTTAAQMVEALRLHVMQQPEDEKLVIDALVRGMGEGEDAVALKQALGMLHWKEAIREAAEATRIARSREIAKAVQQQADRFVQLGNRAGVVSTLEAVRGGDIPHLRPEDHQRLTDHITHQMAKMDRDTQHVDHWMNARFALNSAHFDPTVMRRVYFQLQEQGYSAGQAASWMLQRGGRVPEAFVREMEDVVSDRGWNPARAIELFSPIFRTNRTHAQRLAESFDNGDIALSLANLTADASPSVVADVLSIISLPHAKAAYQDANELLHNDLGGIQAALPAAVNLPATELTPDIQRQFQDRFRLAYIQRYGELAQLPPLAPERAEARDRLAAESAELAAKRAAAHYTVVELDGRRYVLRNSDYNISPAQPEQSVILQQAAQQAAIRVKSDLPDASILFDSPVKLDGVTYIPVTGMGPESDTPSVQFFIEVDTSRSESDELVLQLQQNIENWQQRIADLDSRIPRPTPRFSDLASTLAGPLPLPPSDAESRQTAKLVKERKRLSTVLAQDQAWLARAKGEASYRIIGRDEESGAVVDADLFGQLVRTVGQPDTPAQWGPYRAFAWHQHYQSQYMEDHARRLGDERFVADFIRAKAAEFQMLGMGDPVPNNRFFAQFLEAASVDLGWQGFALPEAEEVTRANH